MDIKALKSKVFPGESGGDYNALFGYSNRPGKMFEGVNLTDMTVDEALQFASPSGPYGQWVKGQVGRVATPMGAFQVVGSTLRAAKEGLGLTGNERMDPATQDRIGQWIYQTQGPGAWEAWGRAGGAPALSARVSTQGGQQMAMMEQRPAGLLDALGIQRRDPNAQGETALPFYQREAFGNTLENLQLGLNRMTLRPDPNLAASIGQQREARAASKATNRTAALLRSRGRADLAEALEAGSIKASDAVAMAYQQPEDPRTALQKNYEFFLAQGMTEEQALSAVRTGNVINMPGAPTIGTIPPGYQAIQDPQTGVFRFEPIAGGPVEADARAASEKAEMRSGLAEASSSIVVTAAERARKAARSRRVGGVLGPLAAMNPATANAEIVRQVGTLQSMAAAENINAMRQASPTGGALGNASDADILLLKQKSGALDPFSPNFERDLDDYERTLLRTIHGFEEGDRIYKATRGGLEMAPKGGGQSGSGQSGSGQGGGATGGQGGDVQVGDPY